MRMLFVKNYSTAQEKVSSLDFHWRGLPFALKELRTKGYSIIHSTKNNRHYTEQEIGTFFKSIRTAEGLNVD